MISRIAHSNSDTFNHEAHLCALYTQPHVSEHDEQQLLAQLALLNDDPVAAITTRNRLIENYLPLVITQATCHQHPAVELEDLVQEGNLALILATRSFDPQRHPPFRTFALRFVCWHLTNVVHTALQRDGGQFCSHDCPWCKPGAGAADIASCCQVRIEEIERT